MMRVADGSTDMDEIDLLAGADTWHTPAVGDVPAIRMSDGPAGVRGTSWDGPASASFPCGSALGATFDPDLVREVGEALGREARAKSAHVLLGPTVNLHRTPIGGRNFECMSEDPRLTAAVATAYVEGVQSQRVACCIKHFVANDTEFARMVVSSEVAERVLRELYLVPFEEAVGAGVRSVMTAYNRLNGTFCSEHEWLLRDVLRHEWGFDGVVVSDWHGTHSTVAALRAGLDVEMPGPTRHRGDELRAALAAGEVTTDMIDAAVERLRRLADWTGAATTGTAEVTAADPATRAVTRRAAAAGSVLLRNEPVNEPVVGPGDDPAAGPAPLLPLPVGSSIALVGPYAATGRVQGGGSAKVRPDRPSALLDALRRRRFAVRHAVGCRIDKTLPVLRGEFHLELVDGDGTTWSGSTDRLELVRQHASAPPEEAPEFDDTEFGTTMTGTFVPEEGGTWRIGLRSVGPSVVRLDGREVVRVDGATSGGYLFGHGSPETFGTIELTAGRPVAVEVEYPVGPNPGLRGVTVGGRPVAEPDLVAEAAALATDADVAVVVVGTNDEWETEGEDRASIDLPGRQDELVTAVATANPRTVVVVNAGSPVAMPWIDEVAAVLHVWFPGGQFGVAITDVLSGDVEPGGRLPVTFPRRLEDTPAFDHHPGDGVRAPYAEGLLIGHRWYDEQGIEPLFWFGHGLGYTTFEMGAPDVRVDLDGTEGPPGVRVELDVTNTGGRPGAEVVQVYARYRGDHPDVGGFLRFVGSTKLNAVPGETHRARVAVPRRAFEAWLDDGWVLPGGTHEICVGRSSAALVGGRTFEV